MIARPCLRYCVALVAFGLLALSASRSEASGDINGDGYLGLADYDWFELCFSDSGPGTAPLTPGCLEVFDLDGDDDVDLADFALFEQSKGHLPIPLRDSLGEVLTVDSTTPYSGRQTCGSVGCHDIDYIANGLKFQQGRTDTAGNIIVQDDYFEDGRWWIRGGGRYGLAMPVGSATILAAKESTGESDIDLTTFAWVGDCGSCHVGGGPGEFDRDGNLLYNQVTGEFGFELLDKTWDDVEFDGDYSSMDFFGNLSQARWDITGLEEPDCMYCHTSDPTWGYAADNRNAWRTATLAGMTALVDDYGNPVPAYAAAGAASQGWFSNMETNGAGAATVLQIDYSVGVGAGTLMANLDDTLALGAASVDRPPRDKVCWGCHSAAGVIRGQVWFDERVIHYAGLNNLTDEDPSNDIPPERSTSCNYCHPGNLEHNFAKGNNPITSWRNELDWVNLRSCRECHLTEFPNGDPNPDKHPDAPDVPGTGEVEVHLMGFYDEDEGGPMRVLSCQACHIPYPLLSPAWAVMDASASGIPSIYPTTQFYSADPLDPSGDDKSRWWVGLVFKVDSDGVTRAFPEGLFHYVYWGDWDQNGTPEDLSDDTVAPIALWRVRDITGGAPLPALTDDNGDGNPEVNRPEEILAYIQALKGNDHYGEQVASNPVLSKGYRVFYEDPDAPGVVSSFYPDEVGMNVDHGGRLGLSHSVLAATEAWGHDDPENPEDGCNHCHRFDGQSPVLDRKILVDPFGPDGLPEYKTVREMTGFDPP